MFIFFLLKAISCLVFTIDHSKTVYIFNKYSVIMKTNIILKLKKRYFLFPIWIHVYILLKVVSHIHNILIVFVGKGCAKYLIYHIFYSNRPTNESIGIKDYVNWQTRFTAQRINQTRTKWKIIYLDAT